MWDIRAGACTPLRRAAAHTAWDLLPKKQVRACLSTSTRWSLSLVFLSRTHTHTLSVSLSHTHTVAARGGAHGVGPSTQEAGEKSPLRSLSFFFSHAASRFLSPLSSVWAHKPLVVAKIEWDRVDHPSSLHGARRRTRRGTCYPRNRSCFQPPCTRVPSEFGGQHFFSEASNKIAA